MLSRKAEIENDTNKTQVVDNAFKHGVTGDEIWEIFLNVETPCAIVRYKTTSGDRIYNAYGVTESGRYLDTGFIKESTDTFRVIHAMDMKKSARQRFKKMGKIR